MNERIKLLAHQADWDDEFREDFDIQKFAQLIVRECVAKIRKGTENTAQYDLAYNAMLTAIIADIQESFGVE
jgi:hypothetical protein